MAYIPKIYGPENMAGTYPVCAGHNLYFSGRNLVRMVGHAINQGYGIGRDSFFAAYKA
jgi:hypothetical protein